MKKIKIKCPAKINLTLEVLNKRDDGFHNIKSIMQMISLCDYLTLSIAPYKTNEIILAGSCGEIPYDKRNLVYKAALLFLLETKINGFCCEIYIEKNIPVSAGLAGGSTDAAGTLFGLNCLFDNILPHKSLENLCAQLGSDLNVCLNGGCRLASSKGEITEKLPDVSYPVTIIKPKNLGISAKEAYQKYSLKKIPQKNNMTEKMADAIRTKSDITPYLYNALEYAVFDDYKELQIIKSAYPDAVMSGSGSAYFVPDNLEYCKLDENYLFINNLKFIKQGVAISEQT